jgi:hypothetical protein
MAPAQHATRAAGGANVTDDQRHGPVDLRQLSVQGEADRDLSPRPHARFDSSPGPETNPDRHDGTVQPPIGQDDIKASIAAVRLSGAA